ncbi:MAG TPA: cysteine desulfurase family protein [Nitrososphaerales archaeon]
MTKQVLDKRVNFDYSSGVPVDPEVFDAMKPYFVERYGNPSSLHYLGAEARKALEDARQKVSVLINAQMPDREIYFTSGTTESNNLGMKGVALRNRKKGDNIVISSIEHISVINTAKYLQRMGFRITKVPVDSYGTVDVNAFATAITQGTVLASVIYANNEIGTIQPIKELGKIAREKGVPLHVDASAAAGKVPIDISSEYIDLLTVSSNDMYGPKGIGALYVKEGTLIEPIIHGGGQERGIRSGSENIPGIVGMGKAAELAKKRLQEEKIYTENLRDRLIKGILGSAEEVYLHGHPTKRLPGNVAARIFGVEGESVIMELDRRGIAASTGSACASKNLEPSHVLAAIGLNEIERHGVIQLSLCRYSTKDDVDYLLSVLPEITKKLRDLSPVWKFRDRLDELYKHSEP